MPAKPAKPKAPSALRFAQGAGWANVPAHLHPTVPTAAAPQSVPTPPAAPPAPETPRVMPFYNPQNKMDLANFNYGQANSTAEIDGNLANLATQTAYQQTQVDDAAKKGTSNAQDDAAARGLASSSIKDGTLADIEGQRTIQKQYLGDQLANAKIQGDAQKAALVLQATGFMKGMDGAAVQNADAINAQIQPADPTPAPAPAATPAATPPPGSALAHAQGAGWGNVDMTKIVTQTYKSPLGHPVHVFGDGHKEIQIDGVWRRV